MTTPQEPLTTPEPMPGQADEDAFWAWMDAYVDEPHNASYEAADMQRAYEAGRAEAPAEPKAAPDIRTVDADQFAALCNLFCFTHCGPDDPTPAEAGDILFRRAYPMVCDHSRTIARVVLAYLGFRTGIPEADELISDVHAAMRNGKGSLPDGANSPEARNA